MASVAQYVQAGRIHMANPLKRAWLAISIGILVASFAAPITRAALDAGSPAMVVSGIRLTFAFLILTPLVLSRYRDDLSKLDRRTILLACLAGIWISAHFTLLAISLNYTKLIVMQTIGNTGPLWVGLMETTILRARLPRIVWAGLLLAILGSTVIGLSGLTTTEPMLLDAPQSIIDMRILTSNTLLGALLALVGAIAGSIYLTIGRAARSNVGIVPYVWMLYGTGAVSGLMITQIAGVPVTGHAPMAYFWLLILALGPQLIAHSGFNYALAHIPATITSLSTQIVSVAVPILAFFLFAEVPAQLEVAGSAIIIAGVILATVGRAHNSNRLRRQALAAAD